MTKQRVIQYRVRWPRPDNVDFDEFLGKLIDDGYKIDCVVPLETTYQENGSIRTATIVVSHE